MQLFTSNWLPERSPPAMPAYGRAHGRSRYGGSGASRRNENGLLAVVERHREQLREAAITQPAERIQE
ncbi:MAG: hypothetical protein M3Q96_09125 [Pseudomonadota bacterium]|nr:hypothetical protein [Pseudomonadota bacterium]